MKYLFFPTRPCLTFTKWGATSSTLPISLLSFDLTFLPLSFSHGTLTIFVDGGVETPVADVPGIGEYLGILLSKSGYCFLTDSLLCMYSGVSNSEKSLGGRSLSNFSFTFSFLSAT